MFEYVIKFAIALIALQAALAGTLLVWAMVAAWRTPRGETTDNDDTGTGTGTHVRFR